MSTQSPYELASVWLHGWLPEVTLLPLLGNTQAGPPQFPPKTDLVKKQPNKKFWATNCFLGVSGQNGKQDLIFCKVTKC